MAAMAILPAALLCLPLPAAGRLPPLFAVPAVDLPRYMGMWHEIAHIPNFAQKGCADTIVHYRLNEAGGFDLANTCWKGGKYKPYFGVATPSEPGATAMFKAKFLLFFKADYWIVDLDPEYGWAAVGTPKRDQLWVISREPSLDPSLYEGILARAQAQGFDTARLTRTVITGRASKGFGK